VLETKNMILWGIWRVNKCSIAINLAHKAPPDVQLCSKHSYIMSDHCVEIDSSLAVIVLE